MKKNISKSLLRCFLIIAPTAALADCLNYLPNGNLPPSASAVRDALKCVIENSVRGEQGPPGEQGPVGPKGAKGDTGPAGPMGPKGTEGDKGPKGDKGDRGSEGPQGKAGPKGTEGDKGPKGDKGDRGLEGPQGKAGPKGTEGDKGPKGDKGDRGPEGSQGKEGPKGATGAQGEVGATGATGPQGPKGDTGMTGPQGQTGETGKPGPQGQAGVPGVGLLDASDWQAACGEGNIDLGCYVTCNTTACMKVLNDTELMRYANINMQNPAKNGVYMQKFNSQKRTSISITIYNQTMNSAKCAAYFASGRSLQISDSDKTRENMISTRISVMASNKTGSLNVYTDKNVFADQDIYVLCLAYYPATANNESIQGLNLKWS